MERWQGQVAVVTGASSGIGLVTAIQLVQHGLIVIGLARRANQMKEGMKNVTGPGKFYARECDITNEQNVIETFDWIKCNFKTVNILVNNAGVMKMKKIEDASTEELENIFKVNVFGLLFCTKQAIPQMRQNQKEGHIINVNSILGHRIMPLGGFPSNVYAASKFAVTALSETLRNELTDSKIRVTSISPGIVKTDMMDSVVKSAPIFKNFPAVYPEDVANSIMHALSAPAHVEINEIILQAKIFM